MKKYLFQLVCVLILAACKPAATTIVAPALIPSHTPAPADTLAPTLTQVPATATPIPTNVPATTTPTPTAIPATATATPDPALPPKPQAIAFTASDGQALNGLFYPANRLNAPVVVLIHWVGGDQSDWYEIAPWLQNRGLKNPFPNPGTSPWWTPTWFPSVPQDTSYNVFIFSLRGCQPFKAGCSDMDPPGWYADIQGAMLQATKLEGVDAARIAAIGSSIGADGAADGCAWLATKQPGVCRGALSLSPGSYLEIAYKTVVKQLSEAQPPVPAWCLADEKEVAFCQAVGKFPAYQAFEIPGGGHGNMLLSPDLNPLPMQLMLDFLQQVLGQ
jgi:pimeloyl-ACP methyl ester carboxylesterase